MQKSISLPVELCLPEIGRNSRNECQMSVLPYLSQPEWFQFPTSYGISSCRIAKGGGYVSNLAKVRSKISTQTKRRKRLKKGEYGKVGVADRRRIGADKSIIHSPLARSVSRWFFAQHCPMCYIISLDNSAEYNCLRRISYLSSEFK